MTYSRIRFQNHLCSQSSMWGLVFLSSILILSCNAFTIAEFVEGWFTLSLILRHDVIFLSHVDRKLILSFGDILSRSGGVYIIKLIKTLHLPLILKITQSTLLLGFDFNWVTHTVEAKLWKTIFFWKTNFLFAHIHYIYQEIFISRFLTIYIIKFYRSCWSFSKLLIRLIIYYNFSWHFFKIFVFEKSAWKLNI